MEGCYAAENNGAGIFIEISETATVRKNICVRNGLKNEPGAWQGAGILLGEAMHCTVESNICVGNRMGIEIRQQGIRSLPADASHDRPTEKQYYSDGHVFTKNIAAFNKEWQFAADLRRQSVFRRQKAEATPDGDGACSIPDKRGWQAGNNDYFAAPGEGLSLWGAKWLPKHQEFSDLKKFAAEHGLDSATSVGRRPAFRQLGGWGFYGSGSGSLSLGAFYRLGSGGLATPNDGLSYTRKLRHGVCPSSLVRVSDRSAGVAPLRLAAHHRQAFV